MRNIILISVDNIKSNSVVNNNVDEMYILPAITTAQDMALQPIIGTKLFRKLQNLVADGSIQTEEDYKFLLDEYINPVLLNQVTADLIIPISFKLRNQGFIQQTGDRTYVPSMADMQLIRQDYQNKADFYKVRLSEYLMANRSKYPEYCSRDSCADMNSNPSAYKTGIYLG